MALLYNFPQVPDDAELSRLRQEFYKRCRNHLFLARLPISTASSDSIAPNLGLAMACLASVSEQGKLPIGTRGDKAQNIYLAGLRLWTVMLEVDNREARSFETVAAAVLLLMYGPLHPDGQIWKQSGLMMGQSATITRRLRLQDPSQVDSRLAATSSNPLRAYSSVVCLLWLDDILHTLHLGIPRNFRTPEIWIKMPSSGHEFQSMYRALIEEQDLPNDLKTPEDGMLLLIGIISDMISINRALRPIVQQMSSKNGQNPYLALSPRTELDRMQNLLSNGLDKWHGQFGAVLVTRPEIAAFYHFCRMYIICPDLPILSKFAGYRSETPNISRIGDVEVTPDATRAAWFVLDSAATRAKAEDAFCAVWLPVIVFQAGLVIAARLNSSNEQDALYNGPRALTAFKIELEHMPWPCCEEMTNTLQRLMSTSLSKR